MDVQSGIRDRLGSSQWTGVTANPDPFGRMLAAQSAIESLPLATTDEAMALFGIERV